jgi:ABC-2 type transport system ATP-binding protein
MIELNAVAKNFKHKNVLSGVTWKFEDGIVYGITGHNGCGKTVLLKLVCGLMKPDSGTIAIDGTEIGRHGDLPQSCGVIIETPIFWSEKTGMETLQYLAGFQKKIGDKEIRDTLERVGLYEDRNAKVGKYSLGMKQRLAIAQAVMEDQKILLLDEPTNSLDEDGVILFNNIIKEEKAKNKTIILVTHNFEDIKPCMDCHLKLTRGKLTEAEV